MEGNLSAFSSLFGAVMPEGFAGWDSILAILCPRLPTLW